MPKIPEAERDALAHLEGPEEEGTEDEAPFRLQAFGELEAPDEDESFDELDLGTPMLFQFDAADEASPATFDLTSLLALDLAPDHADEGADELDGPRSTPASWNLSTPPNGEEGLLHDNEEGSLHDGEEGLLYSNEESGLHGTPWLEETLVSDDDTLCALAGAGQSWVAAGRHLLWFRGQPGARVRCAVEGGPVESLALVSEVVVYTTQSGALGRRHLLGPQPELLPFAPGMRPGAPARVGLFTGTENLWLLASGVISVSADLGNTWTKLPLDGAHVLEARGTPLGLLSVVSQGGALHLWCITADGAHVAIDAADSEKLLSWARTSELVLCAASGLVLLGAPGQLTRVSRDGGASFTSLALPGELTAAASGVASGEPRIWLSCYEPALDQSVILEVTPREREARLVARWPLARSVGAEGEPEPQRIRDLLWDTGSERLLALGPRGAAAFTPRADE